MNEHVEQLNVHKIRWKKLPINDQDSNVKMLRNSSNSRFF